MIIKVRQDKQKSESLRKMAEITLERLNNTDMGKYPSNTLLDYYDAVHKLMEALALREHQNNTNGIIINYLHLAEYYSSMGKMEVAIGYSEQAGELSQKIQNYRDYLESLEFLGNFKTFSISFFLTCLTPDNKQLSTVFIQCLTPDVEHSRS